ncbi:hypothetical protein ACLQ2N_08355 [Streptomyces sp. DT224]|uniref:hypothetical protein n=1 Tax=Streptomyces sp. DT224 TaxID=3393426 RepID=UPI003CEC976F
MTGPRRLPPGWHDPGPANQAPSLGEQYVDDDAPDPAPPPNRAARRAYARTLKKKGHRR